MTSSKSKVANEATIRATSTTFFDQLEERPKTYLEVISDPRWTFSNNEESEQPQDQIDYAIGSLFLQSEPFDGKKQNFEQTDHSSGTESSLSLQLKKTIFSPLAIDLPTIESQVVSTEDDFKSNGKEVCFDGNEECHSNENIWTPMTRTIFGPSLVEQSFGFKLQKSWTYSLDVSNNWYSFENQPPKPRRVEGRETGQFSPWSPSIRDNSSNASLVDLVNTNKQKFCQFCKNNGYAEEVYTNHILKTPDGKVVCPFLRAYNCPICNNGGGDYAHTKRYCKENRPTNWFLKN